MLTNGLFYKLIINNLAFSFSPVLIPFFYSFIGLYFFSLEENSGMLKVKSKCMMLGSFFSKFKSDLTIPTNYITKIKINKNIFGLKKEMKITFKTSKNSFKKTFNISLLSKKELKLLSTYINNKNQLIVNE
jgi:hypothetical protein